MWNQSGPNASDKACFQNKEYLLRASIEAKDIVTRQVFVLAECSGQDFVNFEWLAQVRAFDLTGSKKLPSTNIGLVLVTRDKRVVFEFNGNHYIEDRTDKEKLIHYTGFGR